MSEPYAHVGIADVHDDERPGLTCDDCQAHGAEKAYMLQDNYMEHWAGVGFAAVPGGASGPRYGGRTWSEHIKKFDGDLTSYREARRNGLRPEQTNKKAVERAEKKEYSRERVDRAIADGKVVIEAKER